MSTEPDKESSALSPNSRLAIAAVVAFALGAWIFGDRDQATNGHAHDRAEETHSGTQKNHQDPSTWTCSMHPQIQAPEPGKCPICGMDLIPVESDNSLGADESRSLVTLSKSAKERAKIRTTPVRRLTQGGTLARLLGRVDYDETSIRRVTAWTGGRIDHLMVAVTGQRIKAGQVIARLYSPEIYGAHQDLINVSKQLKRLQNASDSAKAAGRAAIEASRSRLRLLGVPPDEVAAMERANTPQESVGIRTPFSGTVIERLATEGSYVKTGQGLYRVANLKKLWVQLDAYESDLPLLQVGQTVSLLVEALPGEIFTGRVAFVDPVLNRNTRTARVRVEVRNHSGKLKPGLFVEATIEGKGHEKEQQPLVIPATAPLFTGQRQLVYVEVEGREKPTYSPRVVRLGSRIGELYPVISGLTEGERVVTHGAFTLDADLQIRGGNSMLSLPGDNERGKDQEVLKTPAKLKLAMRTLFESYLAIHDGLSSDDFKAAYMAAAQLKKNVRSISRRAAGATRFASAFQPISRHILSHLEDFGPKATASQMRTAFKDLSLDVSTVLRIFGNPTTTPVRVAFCPMALDGDGAQWVQAAAVIENPYFGAAMHSCGEVHHTVEHGTWLPIGDESEATEHFQDFKPSPAPSGTGHTGTAGHERHQH